MKKGTRSFEVRRPKCEDGGHEVSTREGPEELTLRTEGVGSQKSCIKHAFCQAINKGIEGEDWEELYDCYTEMSRAVGVKKPNENQKAKAFGKMKAAKDREEDFYDPERKDNILEK